MYRDQKQLVETLVTRGLLTAEQAGGVMQKAEQRQQQPETVLLTDKIVDEEKLVVVKAALLNVPPMNLRGVNIPDDVLKLIPQEVAQNYQMVAFKRLNTELQVGLINPQNFKAIEAVEFLAQKAGLKVRYFIVSQSSLESALNQYQELGEEVQEALATIKEDGILSSGTRQPENMEEVVKSAPVSKMVLVIIRHALEGRASDIHIEPAPKETRVRYRIDGTLRTSLILPKYIHSAIVARIKVLANLKLDETRKPQDGRIRLTIEGKDIDFRVSTLPLYEGEKVVMRILDSSTNLPSLVELGFNQPHIAKISAALNRPHGLALLTGPTGSGKTTTLYTLLSMVNKEGVNIITLEDPIEYYLDGINQSQVRPDIGYSFAAGLRSILRQDPNVIMVGEIRDEETTDLVIHASLTGHMVLSTLHTNNAVGAIPRLIDLNAEPFLLSSVMNLIIAQRLARKVCPDCKTLDAPPKAGVERARQLLEGIPKGYTKDIAIDKLEFYKGTGCAACGGLGYRGRIAVAEVITIDATLREVISRAGTQKEIYDQLKTQEFISLTQDALLKALQGLTTLEEVLRVSQL